MLSEALMHEATVNRDAGWSVSITENLLDIISQDVSLTRAGAAEWCGPCPWCGGKDRFRVWPNSGTVGRYWCRQCNRKGDAIQYLRDFRGKSYRQAAALVGKPLDELPPKRPSPAQQVETQIVNDYEAWLEEATRETWEEWDEWKLDKEIAELAYRASLRQPNAYSEDRAWWDKRLATLYGRQATLEERLDILALDHMRKTERIIFFTKETGRRG